MRPILRESANRHSVEYRLSRSFLRKGYGLSSTQWIDCDLHAIWIKFLSPGVRSNCTSALDLIRVELPITPCPWNRIGFILTSKRLPIPPLSSVHCMSARTVQDFNVLTDQMQIDKISNNAILLDTFLYSVCRVPCAF